MSEKEMEAKLDKLIDDVQSGKISWDEYRTRRNNIMK